MKPRANNYQKERGERNESRIVAALGLWPMTVPELAAHMHLSPSTIRYYTSRMSKAPRKIYITRFIQTGGRSMAVYSAGDKRNQVSGRVRKPKQPDRIKLGLERVAEQLAMPRTVAELERVVPLSRSRIQIYIGKLRKAKRAHITAWKSPPHRGAYSPVYALGNKPDKPMPPRKTKAERWKKDKSDADKHARINAKRRVDGFISAVKKAPPANPFAALGL